MKLKDFFKSENNWYQGSWGPDEHTMRFIEEGEEDLDCLCLFGALRYCYNIEQQPKIFAKIEKTIGRDMVRWNDDPKTTFQDVQDLVNKLDI